TGISVCDSAGDPVSRDGLAKCYIDTRRFAPGCSIDRDGLILVCGCRIKGANEVASRMLYPSHFTPIFSYAHGIAAWRDPVDAIDPAVICREFSVGIFSAGQFGAIVCDSAECDLLAFGRKPIVIGDSAREDCTAHERQINPLQLLAISQRNRQALRTRVCC